MNYFFKLIKKLFLFGFPVIFWTYIDSKTVKANNKKHKIINKWLTKKFKYFITKYKEKTIITPLPCKAIPRQIWVCWWDGHENMPPLISACYNSVLQNSNDYNVTLITKNNFSEYIYIPEFIIKKIYSNIITITHFSNIIRMLLLYKYGGLWLDATIFVTGNINLDKYESFFTIKREYGGENVSKRRWTGNCIGGIPGFHFYNFICNFLFEYWKHYNIMPAHHLYDYSIALSYNLFPDIKNMFDNIDFNNPNYMILTEYLYKEYDQELYKKITYNTIFHKLNWKKKYLILTSENKETFYASILNNNANI